MRIKRRLELSSAKKDGEHEFSNLELTRFVEFISSKLSTIMIVGVVAIIAIVSSTAVYAKISTGVTDRLCAKTQENRDLLSNVVTLSYSPATAQLDLTKFPSYERLSPETKAWVDEFQALIALGAGGVGGEGDKNENRVPDSIEKLLAKPIC